MQTLLVVKAEIAFDARPRFRDRGVVFQVYLLVFERPPQPLDKDVVHTAPATVHANGNLSGLQFANEFLTGKLRPLVTVEDLGLAPAKSALQRFDTEVEFQGQRQR